MREEVCAMPDSNQADHASPIALNWAAYNASMAALFTVRNQHDVDSPEREAVAQQILALWAAEG